VGRWLHAVSSASGLHAGTEWFCRDENKERAQGNSYVYVFSETRKSFERKDVSLGLYCYRSQKLDFLTFREAEEVGAK